MMVFQSSPERKQYGITLEEALQIAYSDDLDVDGLYIEPPGASILTDEDSAGEEDNCEIDHLSEKQLAANAKIVLRNTGHKEDVNEDLDLRYSRFPASNYSHSVNKTVVEMFELFIGDEVVHYFYNYSVMLSSQNCPNPNISSDKLRSAIAILILSGDNRLPGKLYY
ncbi:hypothetical protein ILUMI_00458 [Ignelater luminosus]|uniref:PiggyBac transposable element-derived protein domain-containing protein n=1 Tax=Ignelater luminosus TaxID=2038154 RepID=A0A8K0GQ73_IGNLU|nr:hypothetical protein ILUMI_00458 [Ignelater luminosus]